MILVIDNYDSFVHNLARYVREAGFETHVVRNDAVTAAAALSIDPQAVILSPGPRRPEHAGISNSIIASLPAATPLLGVCLGHQCLVEAFGGETTHAARPLHGAASLVRHDGEGIFDGLQSPLPVGRYHSLISSLADTPDLQASAWSEEGELMAVRHAARAWFGVQFHPESLLTPDGRRMIQNFLSFTQKAPVK